MKAAKKVIGTLEKCYAVGTFFYDGAEHLLTSAERNNPCYSFDLNGNLVDTIWEGPGGVMTLAQIPDQPILLATQGFYSPDDSASAKIVYTRRINGKWVREVLCGLPFVHRFGILTGGGRPYLIACTLKSAHAFEGDWTCPGRIWVAPLPEDVTAYSASNPLRLTPLVSGLTKNHGFSICRDEGGTFAVVGSENGVLKVVPPDKPDGGWQVERLLDTPVSDMLYLDFDGDGERELLTLSPFHGDTLTILKRQGGVFREVYRHETPLPFLHAIWGAEIGGKMYAFIGNRAGTRELFALHCGTDGKYVCDPLDRGAGPANVLMFENAGRPFLLAANRETDEVALYELLP